MGGPVRDPRGAVRGARDGSAIALDELFKAHWPAAHRAAYLIVHDSAAAEDIAQEAFLAAIRALDRFDRRRPFGPWLHRIVVNPAIDYARAREVRREVPADGGGVAGGGAPPRGAPPGDGPGGRAAPGPGRGAGRA